jgi:hypothetical protein
MPGVHWRPAVVDAAVARMDEAVQSDQAAFRFLTILLCSVPGFNLLAATIILAEIGRDMSRPRCAWRSTIS